MQTSSLGYLASALDPRFKNLKFTSERRDAIYQILSNSIQSLQGVQRTDQGASPRRSAIVLTHQDPSQKTIFDDYFDDVPQQQDDELAKYLNIPNVASNVDPLSWWRDRQDELPILAILANKYLCLSATSVPSERLFSDVGNHITLKRNRLSSNVISNLLFLKRNMDFVSLFD
jgi:hypothetical protein